MDLVLNNLTKLYLKGCKNIIKDFPGPFLTQVEFESVQGKFSELNGYRYSIERQLKKK